MYRKITSSAVLSVFSVCLCLLFSPFFFKSFYFYFLIAQDMVNACWTSLFLGHTASRSSCLDGYTMSINSVNWYLGRERRCALIWWVESVCKSKLSCCTCGSLRETSCVMILYCRGSQLNLKPLRSHNIVLSDTRVNKNTHHIKPYSFILFNFKWILQKCLQNICGTHKHCGILFLTWCFAPKQKGHIRHWETPGKWDGWYLKLTGYNVS